MSTGAEPRTAVMRGAATRRSPRLRLAQARLGYLFLLPTLVAIVIFQYYPAISAVYHAFTVWDGIGRAKFAGFAQFEAFFTDPEFGTAVANIVKLTAFWMLLAVTVPLFVARMIMAVPSRR